MSTITHWIDPGLATAMGWALLHSFWQGAAIALTLAAGLILARRQPPAVRYRLCVSAMAALLLAFAGTFAWIYQPSGEGTAPMPAHEVTLFFTEVQEALPAAHAPATEIAATDHPAVFLNYFEQYLPLLVSGWLLGVLLLSLRMLGEMAYIQHLRHYRCRQPDAVWLEKLGRMQQQMGIRRPVGLLETRRIHGPMVVGVLKQVILLPAGLLSGLPPEQIEAILAHELAHVRRHDYLANLLLSLIEVLLFFNPLMWWISRKARAEREHACDDLALEMTGDALALARSLALLEGSRLNGAPLAMAFSGREGSTLSRVRRLLQRDDKRQVAAKAFWALSTACLFLVFLAFQGAPRQAVPADAAVPAEEPYLASEEPEQLPTPEAGPATPPAEAGPVIPTPHIVQPGADTIPDEIMKAQKEMHQLEEKMRASELALRKKEQALRSQELQARKEAQLAMQSKQKALMELEIQIRNKESEIEMQESEFEIAGHELEASQMELEEQQYALQQQEEQLEQAQGEAFQQKLKAFQEAQRQLAEKERALELKHFKAEKEQQQQAFEKEKALQELQNRRFLLERELQTQEQDMEFKIMGLQHEMEQLEVEQRIIMREIEGKHRELEAKMMKLMESQEE